MKVRIKQRKQAGKGDNATASVVKSMGIIERDLNSRYLEREDVIKGMMYAIALGHHVLITGTHGTSKSALATKLFESFVDARLFNTQCTKFMTEDVVLGIPNVKKMQEEGVIEYVTEGMMPDAHFAFLDELMDANDPVLRALLDILNERIFRRGRQYIECPLRTAVATTNFAKNTDQLAAVVDRFLVRMRVAPLESDDNVSKMINQHLSDCKSTSKPQPLTLKELDVLKATIHKVEVSDEIIELYNSVVRKYVQESQGKLFISDRRKCWSIQLAMAEAVANGRDKVIPSDLEAIRYGLVSIGDDSEEIWFSSAYQSKVTSHVKSQKLRENLGTLKGALSVTEAHFKKAKKDETKIVSLSKRVKTIIKTLQLRDRTQDGEFPELANHFEVERERAEKLLEQMVTAAVGLIK
jgi:MoxR-like ATPase